MKLNITSLFGRARLKERSVGVAALVLVVVFAAAGLRVATSGSIGAALMQEGALLLLAVAASFARPRFTLPVLLAGGAAVLSAVAVAALAGLGGAGMYYAALPALLVVSGALAYLARRVIKQAAIAMLGWVAALFGLPVIYIREQFWWAFFCMTGAVVAVSLYMLATNRGSHAHLYLAIGGTALISGAFVQLVRHKWAGAISVAAGIALVGTSLSLLGYQSDQTRMYNQAMEANKRHDWVLQDELLDASLSAYDADKGRSNLWRLVFPEPSLDLAARARFHKANGFLQQPNKGREAYKELVTCLSLNPGNHLIGLQDRLMAQRRNDALHAARNLEKLIFSGQAGGAGMPNGKGGRGQPQEQGPQRDPGKEPQPGSGRNPRNSL